MKGKLRPSQHYRLMLLARRPCRYSKGDQEIPGLMKMGFVEPQEPLPLMDRESGRSLMRAERHY
ncbi:hypothetical protein MKK55_22420 [Methylobacterium sp. J-059]|uniref:hypothetical protein n=1 Tax=Methylobacterium sp. J-059 TaxID=2836643 RepID=UPI001FB8C216|nr:hypothetical protein [Methylobacterium sp. J-059]MCJ2041687.1 hypothetical protein [Methylobacterium sp. J-059]